MYLEGIKMMNNNNFNEIDNNNFFIAIYLLNNIHLMNINSCMNLQSKEIIDLKTKYFQFIF